MAAATEGIWSSGLLLAHLHVDDHLREDLQVRGQLVEGFAGAGDQVEHHEGGQQAVAGGGQMRKEDVAGLLAAQRRVFFCISSST